MKFRDTDINLIRSERTLLYDSLVPTNDFLYLKILDTGRILISTGNISKSVFNKSNKWFTSKNLVDINMEFFSDYILNMLQRVTEDQSAYQFNFQHKGNVMTYVCCIYPCMAYDQCKSFDVIIRKNDARKSNASFFMSLKNSTV